MGDKVFVVMHYQYVVGDSGGVFVLDDVGVAGVFPSRGEAEAYASLLRSTGGPQGLPDDFVVARVYESRSA